MNPVLRGLFVEVSVASLARACGADYDKAGMPNHRIEEDIDFFRPDMFNHLKAPQEIKGSSQIQGTFEVVPSNLLSVR